MLRSFAASALVALLLLGGGCSRGSSQQAPGAQPSSSPPSATPSTTPGPSGDANAAAARTVTIPANTLLHVRLDTPVASDSSRLEDPVRASVAKSVVVDGVEAVPVGSPVSGVVTEAHPSGKVKGLARVAFRFDQLGVAGGLEKRVQTRTVAVQAPSTKRNDAMKIGLPAAGGAIVGGILGGGKGAAIGGAVGAGAGTAVVLSTPGKEVHLPSGTALTVKLLEPVTVSISGDR